MLSMASLAQGAPARASRPWVWDWRGAAMVWAAMAAAYLLVLASISYKPYDGDDLMRLQQVRDLLAGQSWFDVTQYRMNPPDGAAMHWSRLVDIPLAGSILLLRLFMSAAGAEYWASVLVPLAYLGAALFLSRAIMLRLGFSPGQVLAGLGLAILFPLLPPAFAPMRIDHHSPQALAAMAGALLLLHAPDRRAAMLAGLAAAAWLVISLEGLPAVALLAALYGLRYAVVGDRSLGWFLGALALAAPVLSLATRPASEFAQWCDILLPAHWAGFAAAAAIAALLPRLPGQEQPLGRLVAIGLLPLVCAPLALLLTGECAAGPFATLSPMLQIYWYDHIYEGLPVWKQGGALALPALYTALLVPAGLWAAFKAGLVRADNRLIWILYAALAFGVAVYGLFLMREMLVAQLLALPLALALAVHFVPIARNLRFLLPRVFATVGCVILVTPAGASLAGMWFDRQGPAALEASTVRSDRGAATPCDFATITRLDRGHVFTSFNSAPTVLVNTPHSVEVGGYHRNTAGLERVIRAFTGEAVDARRIVAQSGADYLVACLRDDSLAIFAHGRPDSLAARVLTDDVPRWLVPAEGFETGSLRVWRIR